MSDQKKLTLKLDPFQKKKLEDLFKKTAKQEEITLKKSPKTPAAATMATKQEQKSEPVIQKEDKVISKVGVKEESKKVVTETPKKKKHNIIAPKDYIEILKHLKNDYPKCFSKEEIKPLEIGIREKLLAIEEIPFANVKIRNFLKAYTRTKKYKESLIAGASRVNLEGEETSKIVDSEVIKVKPVQKSL